MRQSLRSRAVLVPCLLALAGSVHAASLEVVTGEVMASSGGGYRLVAGTTELRPGDAIFVRPKAGASLVYPDGCRVAIAPATVVWVAAQSPCVHPAERDPDPYLKAAKVFDPAWLGEGAELLGIDKKPAGP
jgi:hypothetical protein